jgi:hypothetical protein
MSATIVTPKNINSVDDLNIETKVIKAFSDELVEFVNDVSKAILKDKFFKQYPELMALAFWMRKSHIKELKNYFIEQKKDKILLGRGVVFHVAPSNVDTIFVYSWFISLLVGNSNILRISDKENIQTELLLNIIVSVLYQDKYNNLQDRVAIIRYGHIDEITKKLSSMADVRVIWGGDNTVKHIRTIPISPTAIELTFADKFSFAVFKSTELLKNKEIDSLVERFYNDAFWFGQMACSSIRLVAWVGDEDNNKKAQQLFWDKLNKYVLKQKPEEIAPADIVNKFLAECSMAIEKDVVIEEVDNPYINKVKIQKLNDISEELHCGTGLFYEIEIDSLENILPYITKKHQTIAQYGFSKDELTEVIYQNMPVGIDRIVPVGKSLDFSNVWDGFDLLNSFCREIEILVQ